MLKVIQMPRNKLSDFDKNVRLQISSNLKRLTAHLTQNQLSDMTGIPSSTLSGYFSMRSTINPENTQKIADALGVLKSDIDPRFSPTFNKKVPKDLRKILEDEEITLNGRMMSAEDKEKMYKIVEAAFWEAKEMNKRKK